MDLTTLFSYVQDIVPRASSALKVFMDECSEQSISVIQYVYDGQPFIIDGSVLGDFPPLLDASQYAFFSNAYFMTIASALLIAILPIIVLFLLFHVSRKTLLSGTLLPHLLSFAAGTLLADVFLHLLPETYSTMSSTEAGLGVLAGILALWLFSPLAHNHHDHKHIESSVKRVQPSTPKKQSPPPVFDSPSPLIKTRRTAAKKAAKLAAKSTDDMSDESQDSENNLPIISAKSELPSRQSSVWLQLAVDGLHNFTDGLALSAAWLNGHSHHNHAHSHSIGISTTLAILMHELPHNLSDLLVLIHVGKVSVSGAFLAQWITGLCVLIGALCGLLIGSATPLFKWLLPFSAGNFLHLSLVTMLPEINSASKKPSTIAANFVSFFLGAALIYFID